MKYRFLFIFIIILLAGCNSESSKPEEDSSAPDWIHTPSLYDRYYWGVGYSEDQSNPVEAKNSAVEDGKAKLAEIIESRISSTVRSVMSSVEGEKDSSFQQEYLSEIKVKSNAVLRKVIVDRTYFTKLPEGVYHYYALVKISQRDLENEMKRLEKEYLEKIASVDGNLEEGKALLEEGIVGPALEKFIQAAINSTRIPEREEKFQNIVTLIQSTLKNIYFEKINDLQKGTLNEGLPKPIRVKLTYRDTHKTISIKKTNLKFYLKGNPTSFYNPKGYTDNKGIAESRVTRIKRVGKDIKMVVKIDLRQALDGFDLLVDPKWKAQKTMVEEAMDSTKTVFHFNVISSLLSEKSVLMVIEKDLDNIQDPNPISESVILRNLKNKGVANITVEKIKVSFQKDKTLLSLKEKGIQKLYYVEITRYHTSMGKRNAVSAQGKIQLLDVETGEILAEATSKHTIVLTSDKSDTSTTASMNNTVTQVADSLVKKLFNRL